MGDHDIELVGPGGLEWCRRCGGGEVELQEPCTARVTAKVAALSATNARPRALLKRARAAVNGFSAVCRLTAMTGNAEMYADAERWEALLAEIDAELRREG